MPQTTTDDEIQALYNVLEALEPLDDGARGRVIEYTMKRLGMREISTALPKSSQSLAPPSTAPSELELPGLRSVTDIRTLRKEKQPASAIEMAAVVAYYLSEAAPADERRESVTTADLERYFKQANYRLPNRLDMTLYNAKAAGYFDQAGRGAFKLNPVGFNLVTQTLPRGSGEVPQRASRPGKAKPKKTTT